MNHDMKILTVFFRSAFLVLFVGGGVSGNLPILSFDEGYSQLFGDNNLMVLKDGNSVHIALDERTGNVFLSYFIFSFLFS